MARDAWSAIRGFYYQIQLTVVRWLELGQHAVLYCECGEDIDHVSAALMDESTASESRLLEQIKTRRQLTLRSPEALAALTHFRVAVLSNPGLLLSFRFTTTALPGTERRPRFPTGSGINAWVAARREELLPQELESFLSGLQTLISAAKCPAGITAEDFVKLQTFVGSSSFERLVSELIARFEWATGMPDYLLLGKRIPQLLLDQSRAHTAEEAELLSDVLVAHVFRLLSSRGEKRLDLRGLESLLADRSITQLDRRLLTRLSTFAERATRYLSALSSQVDLVAERVGTLLTLPEQVRDLRALLVGIEKQLPPMPVPAPDLPPRLPRFASTRPQLTKDLRALLGQNDWLAIYGESGAGKTFAAALVFKDWPSERKVWISLGGDLHWQEAVWRLEQHLLRIASGQNAESVLNDYLRGRLDLQAVLATVARELGPEALVVVDDLPDLVRLPDLALRLMELVPALAAEGSSLLTTSQRSLPSPVSQVSGYSVAEVSLPFLGAAEIKEILLQAGASGRFVDDQFVTLVRTVTQGHPALVYATVSFMTKQNWALTSASLGKLLALEPASTVRRETRRRVLELVPHQQSRELLCRLSLIGYGFTSDFVNVVALAEPAVDRPGEYFLELIGPWVTEREDELFVVSPLLSDIGRESLSDPVQVGVHGALLRRYLKDRKIDPANALRMFGHAVGARQWKRLGVLLVQLVTQLHTREQAEAFSLVGHLFESGWPAGIDLASQIMIAASQVRYLELAGRSGKARFSELQALTERAGEYELPAAYSGVSLAGPMNPSVRPAEGSRRGLLAWRLFLKLPSKRRMAEPRIPLSVHLWLPLINVQSRGDLQGMFEVLTVMTADERKEALRFDLLPGGLTYVLDWYLGLERARETASIDWHSVLRDLEALDNTARLPGGEALRVPVARARAVVFGEYLKEPEKALEVLRSARQALTDDEEALLSLTAGCIRLDHYGAEPASAEFERVFECGSREFLSSHFSALGFAVESAALAGKPDLALERALQCLRVPVLPYDLYAKVEMIGEVAWLHWTRGNRRKAWGAMAGLAQQLLKSRGSEQPRFREVFLKTGHVLGWMSSIAKSGVPPLQTQEGEEYAEPFAGIFTRSNPAVSSLSKPFLFTLLLTQLGDFAAGLGLLRRSEVCFRRARALAVTEKPPAFALSHINLELADLAARKGNYRDALDFALQGARLLAISRASPDKLGGLSSEDESLDGVWAALPKTVRKSAERLVFWPSMGAAIGRMLATNTTAADWISACDRLQEIFDARVGELECPEYWSFLLRAVREAFGPGADRALIRRQAQELSEDDSQCALILELALARSPGATVQEICGHQVRAYEVLLKMAVVCEPMLEDIGRFIVRTWTHMAETRSFSLRAPKILKDELEAASSVEPASISKILLASIDATGIGVSSNLRDALRDAARQSERLEPTPNSDTAPGRF